MGQKRTRRTPTRRLQGSGVAITDTPNQTLPYNLVSLHCSSPTCVFGFLQYNKHCLRGLLAETEKHLVVPTQSFSPLLSTTGTQQTRTPPFPTSPPLPTAPAPVRTPPPPSFSCQSLGRFHSCEILIKPQRGTKFS